MARMPLYKRIAREVYRPFRGLGAHIALLLRDTNKKRLTLYYTNRHFFAKKYLSGEGLEIGALHNPTEMRHGTKIRYVDILSKEEAISRHPELDPAKIVPVEYVEDGFSLPSFSDQTQDFLVASNVLEHSPDPLGTILGWSRVLRMGGRLLLSVPIAGRCFDRSRPITPIQHFVDDFELSREGDKETMGQRNRGHYEECLRLVGHQLEMNAGDTRPYSEEEILAKLDLLPSSGYDIHFHTFTIDSFAELLEYYTQHIESIIEVEMVVDSSHKDVIALLRKKSEFPCL